MSKNKISVNFNDDDFSTSLTRDVKSSPLTKTNNNLSNVQVAQEAIESLRNLPNDLNKIALSIEKANGSRKGVIAITILVAMVIAIGGYLIIQEQVKRSLAENELSQVKTNQQNLIQNSQALKAIEDDYREKNKLLNKAILSHTATLNEQMETSFSMMKEAYEKREAQLKAVITPKVKKLKQMSEQYQMLEKSNEVLNNELQASSTQLEQLYQELKAIKDGKAQLAKLPQAFKDLQNKNTQLQIDLTKSQNLNRELTKIVQRLKSQQTYAPNNREELIILRSENQRLRDKLTDNINQNKNLQNKLKKLEAESVLFNTNVKSLQSRTRNR